GKTDDPKLAKLRPRSGVVVLPLRTTEQTADVDLRAAWLLQQFRGPERSEEAMLRPKIVIDAADIVIRSYWARETPHIALSVKVITAVCVVRQRQEFRPNLVYDWVQTDATRIAGQTTGCAA